MTSQYTQEEILAILQDTQRRLEERSARREKSRRAFSVLTMQLPVQLRSQL